VLPLENRDLFIISTGRPALLLVHTPPLFASYSSSAVVVVIVVVGLFFLKKTARGGKYFK